MYIAPKDEMGDQAEGGQRKHKLDCHQGAVKDGGTRPAYAANLHRLGANSISLGKRNLYILGEKSLEM